MSFLEAQVAVRFIDRKLDQLRSIVAEFPEENVWQRPQTGVASLGNLVCHVAGSMRDWIENGVAQQEWRRERELEFTRDSGPDRAGLTRHLDETRAHCEPFIAQLDEASWNSSREFRGRSFTVRDILFQQIDHVSYHVGQAAFLRRIVADLEARP